MVFTESLRRGVSIWRGFRLDESDYWPDIDTYIWIRKGGFFFNIFVYFFWLQSSNLGREQRGKEKWSIKKK